MILDGKLIAQSVLDHIHSEMNAHFAAHPDHARPTLAVVLVGDNPASLAYIRMKQKRAEAVGMRFHLESLGSNISQEALEERVMTLAGRPDIHGLIVQAPLPATLDIERVIEKIPEHKDIDGFSKAQIGNMFLGKSGLYSCTPKGIMTLLSAYNINVEGKNVTVIGRSNIVGKPMSLMLINAGATVTTCHSKTRHLPEITRQADIIIIAIGKEKFLTKNMIRDGAVIIDVGSNLQTDGTFCGDVDFKNVAPKAHAISPSPGGV